jgi:diaminohydroxyphosphoribosylaminopyrimidine deaminase/5-amino-6-(5-phosphoribosylamino)uracil reductase
MERALALAAATVGETSPNPPVGCVIVKDGAIVAEASYGGEGTPHAEVAALTAAGDAARGAEVYVTLEPCAHDIRRDGTPRLACSAALVAAGVRKVVFALVDPDERTAGSGRDRLQAVGIEVAVGDGGARSARILEAYIKHRKTGLPFVTAKFVASLDGRIAAASGDSRWVSGPATLAWAHEQRTKIDAIMVGANTVVVDNPRLTARPGGVEAPPRLLRVVLDSSGRISPDAAVLQGAAPTLIATTERSGPAWRAGIAAAGCNVEVAVYPAGPDGRVALLPLLTDLGARGVLSLLVEGGGVLLGSFFDARLVDKVEAVIAPMIIGAANAATPVAGAGARMMADALRLRDVTVERLGNDVLVSGYTGEGSR